MSENLNKEMEEVVEDTLEEETPAHKSVKGKGGVVAPVTTPESQQKDKSGGKQAKQPAAGVAYKEEDEVEEETETEAEELEESLPRLKSEMMDGMVKHMKKMKKEDLAKLYSTTLMKEEDEEEDEDDDEEEMEAYHSKKMKKESIDQTIESLDVSDDVNALVEGEEISEEFKSKAATIFESAVKTKVRAELEKMQEENDKIITDMAEQTMTDLVEKVDDYLNYVVEQWMSENELAIERGLKGEIAEDFISGLKNLFEDHYIDVPDEKYDILEANLTKIEELEEKLNKQIEENVQLRKAKGELVKESLVADVANGMTDTETEKFQSLVEDVEFSDEESYTEKLKTIRESYFGSKEVLTEEGTEETTTEETVEVTDSMDKYLKAIGRDVQRAKQ